MVAFLNDRLEAFGLLGKPAVSCCSMLTASLANSSFCAASNSPLLQSSARRVAICCVDICRSFARKRMEKSMFELAQSVIRIEGSMLLEGFEREARAEFPPT